MLARHFISTLSLAVVLIAMLAMPQMAQGAASCQQKAQETLSNLSSMIGDYTRQMEGAPQGDKAKYDEAIRELNKLKALVEDALEQLNDTEGCTGTCQTDQCSLVDIADQQINELANETQEKLSQEGRFGEKPGEGRQVTVDDDTVGDDQILDQVDPDDAGERTTAEKSDKSDNQDQGKVGDVFDDYSENNEDEGELPEEDPDQEASPQ